MTWNGRLRVNVIYIERDLWNAKKCFRVKMARIKFLASLHFIACKLSYLRVGCSGERLKKCRCNRDAIEDGSSPDHRDGGDIFRLYGK